VEKWIAIPPANRIKRLFGFERDLFLHAAWRAKNNGNEEQLLAIRALMSVFGSQRFDLSDLPESRLV